MADVASTSGAPALFLDSVSEYSQDSASAYQSSTSGAASPHLRARARNRQQSQRQQLWKQADAKAQKSGQRGTVFSTNGDQYTGEWLNNQRDGYGTLVRKSGLRYEGEWAQDVYHGQGSLYVPVAGKKQPRLVYKGAWRAGQRQGLGMSYYQDGSVYEGEWSNNKRNGWGTLILADASKYEGEWVDDVRCGIGSLFLPNGDRFEGQWAKDVKEGPGTMYFIEKNERYDGEWMNGTPRCGTISALDPDRVCDPTAVPLKKRPCVTMPQLGLADPNAVIQQRVAQVRRQRVVPEATFVMPHHRI